MRWLDPTADGSAHKAWRPGWALAAVMGRGLDLLDIDPRNGGDLSRKQLVESGAWPRVYAAASTPSGGTHEFVASMGVCSRDGVLAGFDVKAGLPDGGSRGFAFIAPTVKLSKTSEELVPSRWTGVLGLDVLGQESDDSGRVLAERVWQLRPQKGPKAATRKRVAAAVRVPADEPAGIPGGQRHMQLV